MVGFLVQVVGVDDFHLELKMGPAMVVHANVLGSES